MHDSEFLMGLAFIEAGESLSQRRKAPDLMKKFGRLAA
jgi:hypothetical protein